MGVAEILAASGVQYRETRWAKPPGGTYAVYMDDVTADGADGVNAIYRHAATIELYAAKPDTTSEAAIEAAIDAVGLHYEKQARYWIQSEQLYQTIYDLEYTEKRRIQA